MRKSRLVDAHFHLVGLRQHRHRYGRGVNPPTGLGGRHPLDTVDPAFELQAAVDIPALDDGNHFLEPAGSGRTGGHGFHPPTPGFGKAAVHSKDFLSKEGGFVAPGSGPDLQQHVLFVVGILGQQKHLQFPFAFLHGCLPARKLPPGPTPGARARKGRPGPALWHRPDSPGAPCTPGTSPPPQQGPGATLACFW